MNTHWSPAQYEKFKSQRAKPFYDLLALIEKKPLKNVIDLGCGTGELTRVLFDQLKPEKLLGIDSSLEMLAPSQKFETPDCTFQLADIGSYRPDKKFDLVFSNAALQWLPNHEELIPRVLSWVSNEGQVAIQMPFNFDHPSHVLAAKVAEDLFPALFSPRKARSVLAVERYAEILYAHGFQDQIARIEVYGHPMASGRDVTEWTKGTLLTEYQSQLDQNQFEQFLRIYTKKLLDVIGEGPYFYTFKRVLIWGKRS